MGIDRPASGRRRRASLEPGAGRSCVCRSAAIRLRSPRFALQESPPPVPEVANRIAALLWLVAYLRAGSAIRSVRTLVRVEARIERGHARKTPYQQARARQQHHGDCDLGDHQSAMKAVVAARLGGSAAAFLQGFVQARPRLRREPAPGRSRFRTAIAIASVNASTPGSIRMVSAK